MGIATSSKLDDRARIRELESKLDLSQQQLNEQVRQLVAEADRITAVVRNELAELYEAKAKELRKCAHELRVGTTSESAAKGEDKKLPGLETSSAREAAIAVLTEKGTAMHFSDVARAAVARGYGRGRLDPESVTVQSTFRRTLGKWADLFDRTAPGTYRLANGNEA